MRKEYDFSQSKKNPYTKKLKVRTTIRLDKDIVQYFQELSELQSIPYQSLINLYLRECMKRGRKPRLSWKKTN
ncbi:MAG: BrnA antitoxin family protein [Bdellovibrionales bacterium]|nr:BrnA antitoxin family protein [Bdellovibrionales bacterium]